MIRLRKMIVLLGAVAVVGLAAMPSVASVLGTGFALPDPSRPNGCWEGSTEFEGDTNPLLAGFVHWAVFTPSAFQSAFSGVTLPVDYVFPTTGYIYTYQIDSTGDDPVSSFSVGLLAEADSIGWFTTNTVAGDQPDSNYWLESYDSATWNFSNEIAQGTSSCGLIFNSLNGPTIFISALVDGGTSANGVSVSSPSPGSIPEPATIGLLVSGLGVVLVSRRFRRR
jgi:hypothetical protein